MPRKYTPPRPIREIYQLAKEIGPENVFISDSEHGRIWSSDDTKNLAPSTIANRRGRGEFDFPFFRIGMEPRARLSDVLAFRDRKMGG